MLDVVWRDSTISILRATTPTQWTIKTLNPQSVPSVSTTLPTPSQDMAGYASNRPQPPALYTIQTTITSLHGLDYAGEASHIASISFGEPPKESLRRWKLEGDSRIVEGGAKKQGGKGYLCMHTSLGGEHVTGPHAVDYVDRRARGPSSPPCHGSKYQNG